MPSSGGSRRATGPHAVDERPRLLLVPRGRERRHETRALDRVEGETAATADSVERHAGMVARVALVVQWVDLWRGQSCCGGDRTGLPAQSTPMRPVAGNDIASRAR